MTIVETIVGTFDNAVADLISNLDQSSREQLATLFLNSQASWLWYEKVIERYDLRNPDNPIVLEIGERFPDEAIFKLIESDFQAPTFEAGIILREAKNELNGNFNR